MKETYTFLRPLFIVTAVFLFAIGGFGQTDPKAVAEPSYDVSLQLVIGSNAGGKDDMPQNLSAVGKQIRSSFGFSSYRVTNTIVGRVANNSSFDYKSISNMFAPGATAETPAFLEWSFRQFRSSPTMKGTAGVVTEGIRFGARLPIATVAAPDGKSVINYESIGLSFGKVAVAENVPTLIGTLDLPGAGGTVFLVMTARPVDM